MQKETLVKCIIAGLYLLLLTPLFFHRSFIFPFIAPKVFIFQALVEIVFALYLALIIFYPEYRPRKTPVALALLALLAVFVLSSLLGVDLNRSLWSTQTRSLGLVALFHFAAVFMMLWGLRNGINWRNYLGFSFLVGFVAAFFAGIQLTFPRFFLEQATGRPGSFLGNPAFLSSYLMFHFFVGLWLFGEFRRAASETLASRLLPKLVLVGTLFEGFIIFLTQTRGAIVGFAVGILTLLVYFSLRGATPRVRKVSRGLFLALFIIGTVFLVTRNNIFWQYMPGLNRFTNLSLHSQDIQPRFMAWRVAVRSFFDRPFLGFGFENYKYPFDLHYDPRLLRFGFAETYFDKPHNVLLEHLVGGGVVGLTAYLALFGVALYLILESASPAKPFIFAALLSYLVQNLFIFDTFGSYLMFFVILAFVEASYSRGVVSESPASILPLSSERYRALTTVALVLISLLPAYFLNYRALYANNRQYWGLNYFINRRSDLALEAYVEALTTPNPYLDSVRKDFASSLEQVYSQGVPIPNVEQVAAKAMSELALTIRNQPRDYFLRLTFADLSTVFYVFDERYLEAGELQAREALRLSPSRQQAYYSLAKIKIIRGDPRAALEFMRRAVELDPLSADPHFFYALTALEAGEQKLGFAELTRAKELGREPRTVGEARIVGNYYGEAKRWREAIYFYRLALSENPDDLESKLKLALAYFYSGEKELARKYFEEVKAQFDLRTSPAYDALKPILGELGVSL